MEMMLVRWIAEVVMWKERKRGRKARMKKAERKKKNPAHFG